MRKPQDKDRVCEAIDDGVPCSKPVLAKGICRRHYGRKYAAQKRRTDGILPRVVPDPECSVDGCTQPHFALGYCNSHYRRFRLYGDATFSPYDPDLRFWANVDRRGDDECWPWLGGIYRTGYGQFFANGKAILAHVYAYKRFVGSIPEGLVIDHVRDNGCIRRDCTNFLRHLEPVTQQVNILRGDGPSALNARKTHCKRGHEFTEENTQIGKQGRRICLTCRKAQDRERYKELRNRAQASISAIGTSKNSTST
jgi:hypothetical protein